MFAEAKAINTKLLARSGAIRTSGDVVAVAVANVGLAVAQPFETKCRRIVERA